MLKPIIIYGSSRSKGETFGLVQTATKEHPDIPIIDLNNHSISFYDYEYKNQNDDYLRVMEQVTAHDLIILATPVYWYSMSAQMKVFIDRLSDLLHLRKDLGRKLRGKRLFVLASFNTSHPVGFEDPFRQTCGYMGMQYEGCCFYYQGQDQALLNGNAAQLEKIKLLLQQGYAPHIYA